MHRQALRHLAGYLRASPLRKEGFDVGLWRHYEDFSRGNACCHSLALIRLKRGITHASNSCKLNWSLWKKADVELKDFLGRHRQHVARVSERWSALEIRFAALFNGLSLTSSGQRLLAVALPFSLGSHLFPSRFQSQAYEFGNKKDTPSLRLKQKKSLAQMIASSIPWPGFLSALVEELQVCLRCIFLFALFTPAIFTAHTAFYLGGNVRERWMGLFIWTLQQAGPAFIKWGQWASTRPDLFPTDLCHAMEQLQTSAPAHSSAYSRMALEQAFNIKIPELFTIFEDEPVASGSIAQIHRAQLSDTGARLAGSKRGTMVAVKIRHPQVTSQMHRDFVLMERAARIASAVPGVAELRLEESIRQFGAPLKEQLDLAAEAVHLTRFRHNFRLWASVSFPRPLYPFVASDVLMESFEDGDLVSTFVNCPGYKHRFSLAETGLTCFLQMLLQDNFIHADLHPGNILVQEVDPSWAVGGGIAGWLSRKLFQLPPKLILLDTGMIAELSKPDQRHVIAFFKALTKQDGEKLGAAILNMSERHTCKDPEAFMADLRRMFDTLDPDFIMYHTSSVIESIIETLRQHQVTLRSTVSTVVVTTLVLEGWSSKLNPDLRILDHVRDMLVVDWNERMSRTVDKIMKSGSLAVA